MKTLILSLLFLATIPAQAGEFTGAGQVAQILKSNNMSVESLRQQGLKIIQGEVTGAGRQIPLDRINMVITDSQLLRMRQARRIEYKHPSDARSLGDVQHIEFGRLKVRPNQLKAVIYE